MVLFLPLGPYVKAEKKNLATWGYLSLNWLKLNEIKNSFPSHPNHISQWSFATDD